MSKREQFQDFVCIGDRIQFEENGFTLTARIAFDDSGDRPDERQDGFWPSLDPSDAGYIGKGKTHADLERANAEAQAIIDQWKAGDWFYCGIVMSIAIGGVTLDEHAASLWGIEANYPGSDNAYLNEIAVELIHEALPVGMTQLAKLVTRTPETRDDIVFRRYHNNAAGWIGAVKNARLIGEDATRFAAIFDADGAPIIIEEQRDAEDGWSQILPEHDRFEEISTRLILLWDEVMLEVRV